MRILVFFLAMFALPQAPLRAQLPTITNEPASQTVLWAGVNVAFTVGVSGPGPFTYQWQFNTTNLPNIITTIAGNGTDNYSGDGGAATNASFDFPESVAVDASGNLFIADYFNNLIRKMNTNGIITTVAGGGANGLGDGGAATNASLSEPSDVAVDASGNLFIADEGDYRIRKVNTNGIIVTVAGNGTNGFSGDGGAATNASLCLPRGVAMDASGNLFIADMNNNRIRKVNTNGIITTVAGIGAAGQGYGYSGDGGAATNARLFWPYGVAVDATGNLFIADMRNNRIRNVNTKGIITTVAGGGANTLGDSSAATNASLSAPSGVAVDASGNLFIADTDNNRIRKVDINGIITGSVKYFTLKHSGHVFPENSV